MALGLKSAATQVLGPSLEAVGFRKVPALGGGLLGFERQLRGFTNHISIQSSRLYTGFRFALYAPKWSRFGHYSQEIPGCPIWWVHGDEESLLSQLDRAKSVLLDYGLGWFDTYTPGNVGDWGALVDDILTPVAQNLGFSRCDIGDWALPDIAQFKRENGLSILCDMRVPQVVKVKFITNQIPSGHYKEEESPAFGYSATDSFGEAIRRATEFVRVFAPDWFGVRIK